jgi:glycogen(starch) synthase
MRVLMTADAVGGVWTYAAELVRALRPFGVDVTLATMGGPAPPGYGLDVRESDFALEWMPDPWRDVDAAGEWLRSLGTFDVVHLNGYAHAALPWDAPVVVVAHSDVLSWHRHVRGAEAGPKWDEYRRRMHAGLDAADAIVAPTRAVLDDLGRDGVVIPNGRSSAWVCDVPKEPLVLAAGRVWDEAKNIAAVERVADRLPCPVVVAGEGGKLGALPFVELADWLLRASVFAAPARYEPFGLAALEAALAGCALVLGDIASYREVWGDAATYVDPDDDDALVEALSAPVDRGARERALTYTPRRMAAAYADLYRGLA